MFRITLLFFNAIWMASSSVSSHFGVLLMSLFLSDQGGKASDASGRRSDLTSGYSICVALPM